MGVSQPKQSYDFQTPEVNSHFTLLFKQDTVPVFKINYKPFGEYRL